MTTLFKVVGFCYYKNWYHSNPILHKGGDVATTFAQTECRRERGNEIFVLSIALGKVNHAMLQLKA
jgi:hypothetical protein